ncbi:hypothetical protein CORC01_08695 [Colletotrichum orchidophilum]|uniref:F-box domain-containing protein n=1 Tax=Colletotrichum orchidophilum TaxID=1209926 RepID=A0A1G4B3Y8_9PEZI|nr:uncharacterized protein CORC01_08695 [Colletotrichum orchidophilum]OHE96002.1 hypothetical protein CORC01_08695 [Colletotrichum orchidophilum]
MGESSISCAPSCPLESLPADLLLAILPFLESLRDFGALINASPSLRRFFVAEQRRVIQQIVHCDAAPMIKGAVALAVTPRASTSLSVHATDVVGATKAYASFREYLDANAVDTSIVSADHLTTAIECDAVARDFADLFAVVQRHQLRAVDSKAANAVTTDERDRIALACLRYQLLTQTICARMEQIAGIHDFMGRLHGFLVSYDDTIEPNTQHEVYDVEMFRQTLRRALRRGPETVKIFAAALKDVKHVSAPEYIKGGYHVPSDVIPEVLRRRNVTVYSALSHDYNVRRLRDAIYRHEESLPAITTGGSAIGPSFAPFAFDPGVGKIDAVVDKFS